MEGVTAAAGIDAATTDKLDEECGDKDGTDGYELTEEASAAVSDCSIESGIVVCDSFACPSASDSDNAWSADGIFSDEESAAVPAIDADNASWEEDDDNDGIGAPASTASCCRILSCSRSSFCWSEKSPISATADTSTVAG